MFDRTSGRIRLAVGTAGPVQIELVVRSRPPNEKFQAVDLARFRFEPVCELGAPPPLDPSLASFDPVSRTWLWGSIPWQVAESLLARYMADADLVLAE